MNVLIIGRAKLGSKLALVLLPSTWISRWWTSDIDVINNIGEQVDALTIHANGVEASALRSST
jgi:hypothetical protein